VHIVPNDILLHVCKQLVLYIVWNAIASQPVWDPSHIFPIGLGNHFVLNRIAKHGIFGAKNFLHSGALLTY